MLQALTALYCTHHSRARFPFSVLMLLLYFVSLVLTSWFQGRTQGARWSCPPMAARQSTVNNIIVSGEAILSAENSGLENLWAVWAPGRT